MTRKETHQLDADSSKKKACFACLTPFKQHCWIHPLYPGERVCSSCYNQISKDYKYLIEYEKEK